MEHGTHLQAGRTGWAWLAVAALLAPCALPAAPLVYSEAVDGDLGRDYQEIFELDFGANRFSGEARFIAWMGGRVDEWQFDSDHFYFTLPNRATIRRILLSWTSERVPGTLLFGAGVNFMAIRFDEETGENSLHAFHTVEFDALGNLERVQPFSVDLPPAPEANTFRLVTLTHAYTRAPWDQWSGGRLHYEWIVDVAAVPEPGTLALFGPVFLALAGMWRTNRARVPANRTAQRTGTWDSRPGP